MKTLPLAKGRLVTMAALAAISSLALAACNSGSTAGGSPSTDTSASAGDAGSSAPAATDTSSTTSGGSADICAGAGPLTGAGSTAQQNAIQLATTNFQQQCNAKVSYNGTGSGAGITSFIGKQVDWAGSDSALNPEAGEPAKAKAACGSDAWDLPMITGPISVAYNVKGVDQLVLNADVIAKIFSGQITKWNDAQIAALNKGVTLPDEAITVFFRSDSSGTNDNFTSYMGAAAPKIWTAKHAKDWSGKVGQGKAKTQGVADAVKSTEGGISYVEWSYAIIDQLKMAKIDNGSGPVELNADTVGKTVQTAKVIGKNGDLSLQLDYATKTPGAYPIILVTYEVVCSKYSDPAKGAAVKSFMSYLTSDDYQSKLTSIGSAPLPAPVLAQVKADVAKIS